MYFRITTTSAELVEPDETTSFCVTCPPDLNHERLSERVREVGLGELLPDGDYVMVPVQTIRRMAAGRVEAEWEDELDKMVRYAASKGWTDEDHTHIRAHIERH